MCLLFSSHVTFYITASIIFILQVTYAFPNVPTSSLMFPYHFHLLPSEEILSLAIAEVIEQFGWKRTALLTEDVPVFKAVRCITITNRVENSSCNIYGLKMSVYICRIRKS